MASILNFIYLRKKIMSLIVVVILDGLGKRERPWCKRNAAELFCPNQFQVFFFCHLYEQFSWRTITEV